MTQNVSLKFDDQQISDLLKKIDKKINNIQKKEAKFTALLSAIIIEDVIDHFEQEKGPKGRWKSWSQAYASHMARIGKSQNLILQDTGRLKGGWVPTNMRKTNEGILWFNPIKYAKIHDEGLGNMPERKFSWLSNRAINKIGEQSAKFLEDL